MLAIKIIACLIQLVSYSIIVPQDSNKGDKKKLKPNEMSSNSLVQKEKAIFFLEPNKESACYKWSFCSFYANKILEQAQ